MGKWINFLWHWSDKWRIINKGNEVGRVSFIYKDTKDTLTKLGLLKGDKLNNAGLYLFSNLKPWTLKLAIYPIDERISFIDNRIFKGNILECIEKAYKYIIENTRWKAEIKGLERVEIPEIPEKAIREIVVNSFVDFWKSVILQVQLNQSK